MTQIEPSPFREFHAFQFAQQTKPEKAIAILHTELIPYGHPFSLRPRQKITLAKGDGTGRILLVTKGCFSIHMTNRQLVDKYHSHAMSVVGLVDGYSLFHDVLDRPVHVFRAETACQGYEIDVHKFKEVCDDKALWHIISQILAHRLMLLSARESELIGASAFSVVRLMLIELWLYPVEARDDISVEQFIRQRTQLSRSTVMKILSDMRKNNYITIQHGRLIGISDIPTDIHSDA